MLIAIPTINGEIITRKFGRMNEIVFVEIENNKIINQYSEKVTSDRTCGTHDNHDHTSLNPRHQEIKTKLVKADAVIYKTLCKNWQLRLADTNLTFYRTITDKVSDIITNLVEM